MCHHAALMRRRASAQREEKDNLGVCRADAPRNVGEAPWKDIRLLVRVTVL
jgi:hypothetical protein